MTTDSDLQLNSGHRQRYFRTPKGRCAQETFLQKDGCNMQNLPARKVMPNTFVKGIADGCCHMRGSTVKLLHLRQAIFAFILVSVSGYALAEWSRVMQDEHGTTYVDTSVIRNTPNGAALWTLYDAEVPYLERENEHVHSTRVQTEFDCQKNMARSLNTVKYADRMANGKVVRVHSTPQDWERISPNTGRAILVKLICRTLPSGNTVAPLGATAGWIQLGTTQWGTFYYDPSSIQKSGKTVKLQYLEDHDKMPEVPGGKKRYASAVNLAEYDCIGRRNRILHITEYSEAMGTGNALLALDSPLEWDAIVSDSVAEQIWKAACSSELSSAITNSVQPIPEYTDANERLAYLRWLGMSSEKLKGILPESLIRKEILQTVWYESRRAGLDPALVLGLTETVSVFRKYFVSANGSRGYMAVSPHWAHKIGDGDAQKLFHMQTNFRYGCVILRHLMDKRNGDLNAALGDYYSDSLAVKGEPEMPVEFTRNVLANSKKWESLSP